jgi:colanic acid/amylovoran biosynthesis glycosyltransferase
MNICYVTMVFPVSSETFVSNEVSYLHCHNQQVSVACLRAMSRDHAVLIQERQLEQIPIEIEPQNRLIANLIRSLKTPQALSFLLGAIFQTTWDRPVQLVKSLLLLPRTLVLFQKLRQSPPDVLHLFWGHYPAMLGLLIQRYLPKVVVSISLVAYDLLMDYGISRRVAQTADDVTVIASASIPKVVAMEVASERIHLAFHGLQIRTTPQPVAKIPRRIVTAGRLVTEKAFDDVLQIVHRLSQTWEGLSLVVLGDGPEQLALKQLAQSLGISNLVEFRGYVPYQEVFAEMAQAEIFLFMSCFSGELLPNVVKEAIASRCLCVVSQTWGIEELVIPERGGFVVPQRGVDAAVAKIEKIFQTPAMVTDLTDFAWQHLAENFDLNKIMQTRLDRWQRALQAKGTNGDA